MQWSSILCYDDSPQSTGPIQESISKGRDEKIVEGGWFSKATPIWKEANFVVFLLAALFWFIDLRMGFFAASCNLPIVFTLTWIWLTKLIQFSSLIIRPKPDEFSINLAIHSILYYCTTTFETTAGNSKNNGSEEKVQVTHAVVMTLPFNSSIPCPVSVL